MSERAHVIVTGAANGIGAAAALEFARRGHDLTLVDRDRNGLELVAMRAREHGAQTQVCSGDLTDLDFGESAIAQAIERFGRIDVLVNNAAWREIATMRTIGLDSWERTLRVCLTAPAFMSRAAAAAMEPNRRGVIINVSSIQAQLVSAISPAYVAAKGGLDSLTYELAALYGPHGIRVVALSLGAIDTGLGHDYRAAEGDDLSAEIARSAEDMIPLRRQATPEEAARHIVWLTSNDASYITGTTIVADGGWSHQLSPYPFKQRQFPHQF